MIGINHSFAPDSQKKLSGHRGQYKELFLVPVWCRAPVAPVTDLTKPQARGPHQTTGAAASSRVVEQWSQVIYVCCLKKM